MAKVGRNQLCDCGSGKKYKRCCGSDMVKRAGVAVNREAPPMPSSNKEIEEKQIDIRLPGQRLYADFYVRSADPKDKQSSKGYGGEPGEYKVVFTLSRPGISFHPENELVPCDRLKGDSHLAITPPAISDPLIPDANGIKLGFEISEVGVVELNGYPNDEGYLGKIEMESITTNNFQDAEDMSYYLLAPYLSYLSTYLDIPLHVHQVDITELRTGSTRIGFINLSSGAPVQLAPFVAISNEWRGYASLYREALNSNNPTYRFLCLYKIIDGIRERHKRLAKESRQNGVEFSRLVIVIPTTKEEQTKWLNEIFPMRDNWDAFAIASIFVEESIGKKLGNIIEMHLRPLRNDVAHALLTESGELTLWIDDIEHIQRIYRWLPLMKCLARWLLKVEFPNEFSFSPARQVEFE